MKLTVELKDKPTSEHKGVDTDIMARAMDEIITMIEHGATAGGNDLNLFHSHQGDSCVSSYYYSWSIEK